MMELAASSTDIPAFKEREEGFIDCVKMVAAMSSVVN